MKVRSHLYHFLLVALLSALCLVASVSAIAAIATPNSLQPLTVLMYHNLTENPDETTSMTITLERFRQDVEWLQQNGYTFLLPQDYLAIIHGQQPCPEKPIMLTFDDGYLSNYTLAYPVLQQTGAKASISVIASSIGTMDNKFTWEQAREMYESGLVDIQSHTYNLHNPDTNGQYIPGGPNGIMPDKGETFYRYTNRIAADFNLARKTIEYNVGNDVFLICYPYGEHHNWTSTVFGKTGIQLSMVTAQATENVPGQHFNLMRYGIDMNTPAWSVLS